MVTIYGRIFEDTFNKAMKASADLEGVLEDVGDIMEEITAVIGDALAPVLAPAIGLLEDVLEIVEDLPTPIKTLIGVLLLGGMVFVRIASIVMSLFGAFMVLRHGMLAIAGPSLGMEIRTGGLLDMFKAFIAVMVKSISTTGAVGDAINMTSMELQSFRQNVQLAREQLVGSIGIGKEWIEVLKQSESPFKKVSDGMYVISDSLIDARKGYEDIITGIDPTILALNNYQQISENLLSTLSKEKTVFASIVKESESLKDSSLELSKVYTGLSSIFQTYFDISRKLNIGLEGIAVNTSRAAQAAINLRDNERKLIGVTTERMMLEAKLKDIGEKLAATRIQKAGELADEEKKNLEERLKGLKVDQQAIASRLSLNKATDALIRGELDLGRNFAYLVGQTKLVDIAQKRALVEGAKDSLKGINVLLDGIKKLPPGFQEVIRPQRLVLEAFKESITTYKKANERLISQDKVLTSLKGAFSPFEPLLMAMYDAWKALPGVFKKIGSALKSLTKLASGAIGGLIGMTIISKALSPVFEGLEDPINTLSDAFENILDYVSPLIDGFTDLMESIGELRIAGIPIGAVLITAFGILLPYLLYKIPDAIGYVLSKLKALVTGAKEVQNVTGNMSAMMVSSMNKLTEGITGLSNTMPILTEEFRKLGDKISRAVNTLSQYVVKLDQAKSTAKGAQTFINLANEFSLIGRNVSLTNTQLGMFQQTLTTLLPQAGTFIETIRSMGLEFDLLAQKALQSSTAIQTSMTPSIKGGLEVAGGAQPFLDVAGEFEIVGQESYIATSGMNQFTGSINDALGEASQLNNVLQPLTTNLHTISVSGVQVGTLKDNLQLTGEGAVDMAAGVTEGATGIKKMAKNQKKLQKGQKKTTKVIKKGAVGFLAMIGAGIVLGKLFEAMLPIIEAIGDVVVDLLEPLEPVIEAIGDWIDENPDLAKGLVGLIGAIILFKKVIDIVKGLKDLWKDLKKGWSKIGKIFTKVKDIMIEGFIKLKNIGNKIWNSIKNSFSTFKSFMIKGWKKIKSLGSSIWDVIKSSFDAFKSYISSAWETLKSVGKSVWSAIESTGKGIWNTIKSAYSSVGNWLKDTAWPALKEAGKSIWSGIQTAGTTIWDAIKTAYSTVANWFKDTAWPVLKAAGKGIWDGMKTAGTGVWNAIKISYTTVADWFKDTAWPTLKTAGEDVWNSIKKVGHEIWDVASGSIMKGYNAFKGVMQTAWNELATAGSHIWNVIKKTGNEIWMAAKDSIVVGYNALSKFLKETAWPALQAAGAAVWTAIKVVGTAIWGAIKTAFIAFETAMTPLWLAFKTKIIVGLASIEASAIAAWGAVTLGGTLLLVGLGYIVEDTKARQEAFNETIKEGTAIWEDFLGEIEKLKGLGAFMTPYLIKLREEIAKGTSNIQLMAKAIELSQGNIAGGAALMLELGYNITEVRDLLKKLNYEFVNLGDVTVKHSVLPDIYEWTLKVKNAFNKMYQESKKINLKDVEQLSFKIDIEDASKLLNLIDIAQDVGTSMGIALAQGLENTIKNISSIMKDISQIIITNLNLEKQIELSLTSYSEILAPSLQRGGLIKETELYSLEAGEVVIPTGAALAGFEPTQIVVTAPSPTYYNTYYITVEARELSPAMTEMEKDELARDLSKRIQEEVERR